MNPRELDAAAGDAAWRTVRSIKSPKGLTAQKHRFWTAVIECLEVLLADAREKPTIGTAPREWAVVRHA